MERFLYMKLLTDFSLNNKSEASILKATGLSVSEIRNMDLQDIERVIEKKIKKKLDYNLKKQDSVFSRGSVYAYLSRFITFDVDKKLSKI